MQSGSVDYYQDRYANVKSENWSDANAIHPGYKNISDRLRKSVRSYLTPFQRRVIDIGCGPGFLLGELKPLGFDCFGLDFNPDVIQIAREHFQIQAQVGRAEDLITMGQRFDLALLVHVLEHVEDPLTLLKNIHRLLNPQGILFVDLPNRTRFSLNRSLTKGELGEGEYPPHHLTFWSTRGLANALEQTGFFVLECRPHPFAQEGQIDFFLRNRLRLSAQAPRRGLEKVLRGLGQIVGLQSETLYAVARRCEVGC
jgi:2-polyprenyl-3-methyl-5-hydroxy-6-metoxy-1,4-benzoquinol methylase